MHSQPLNPGKNAPIKPACNANLAYVRWNTAPPGLAFCNFIKNKGNGHAKKNGQPAPGVFPAKRKYSDRIIGPFRFDPGVRFAENGDDFNH